MGKNSLSRKCLDIYKGQFLQDGRMAVLCHFCMYVDVEPSCINLEKIYLIFQFIWVVCMFRDLETPSPGLGSQSGSLYKFN